MKTLHLFPLGSAHTCSLLAARQVFTIYLMLKLYLGILKQIHVHCVSWLFQIQLKSCYCWHTDHNMSNDFTSHVKVNNIQITIISG